MVINNNNNKKYIEITNDEIRFYKWYGKRRLKRNKIRAAFMNDEYKITILYARAIREFNVCNINRNEKAKLEKLINIMNKEGLIFAIDREKNYELIACNILLIQNLLLNLGINDYIYIKIVVLLIVLLVFVLIYSFSYYPIFLYDYNNKYIRLESLDTNRKKEFYMSRDKFKFNYNINTYSYEFESNNVKKVVFSSNIIYPIDYKKELAKLNENTMYCCIKEI